MTETNVKQAILEIRDTIANYCELLEKTGFSGSNVEIWEFIQTTLASLGDLRTDPKKGAKDIFAVFYDITSTIYNLDLIGKVFDIHRITESRIGTTSSSITVSSKYVSDLSGLLDTIHSQLDLMIIKFRALELDSKFADLLGMPELNDLPAFVDEISTIYKTYVDNDNGIHVIDLYFEILQRVYQAAVDKPGSKPIIQHINDTIYDIKQDLLKSKLYTLVQQSIKVSPKINAIQQMMQTFKLIPNGFAPLDDLLKQLDIKPGKDVTKSLATSSKLLKTGFILINKITPNPIRHTIESIIKPKKILPSISGVCPEVIARADTIVPLKVEKLSQEPIVVIGNFDSYYILQTLDGQHWSWLAPWLDLRPVPWDLVLRSDRKIGPSARLGMYNLILNEKILQTIHKPFVENQLDQPSEIKREDAYWNSIRQKVKQSILARYKEYLVGYKVVRTATVRSMLTDRAELRQQMNYIGQLAIDEFGLDQIKIHDQTPVIVQQFKAEMAIAYLREIKSIEKRYLTTLNDLLDENQSKLDRATTAKNFEISLANINRIVSIIEPIIEEHLKIFINRKSSIFITIQNMIDILQKTLLK